MQVKGHGQVQPHLKTPGSSPASLLGPGALYQAPVAGISGAPSAPAVAAALAPVAAVTKYRQLVDVDPKFVLSTQNQVVSRAPPPEAHRVPPASASFWWLQRSLACGPITATAASLSPGHACRVSSPLLRWTSVTRFEPTLFPNDLFSTSLIGPVFKRGHTLFGPQRTFLKDTDQPRSNGTAALPSRVSPRVPPPILKWHLHLTCTGLLWEAEDTSAHSSSPRSSPPGGVSGTPQPALPPQSKPQALPRASHVQISAPPPPAL